ncbi:MAG TPA: Hpt domain-containing protein, partial [Magnetospirillaceae bacterium]|nr:Hpt domain-containing protein [Magnetospirillaceae bacterium]
MSDYLDPNNLELLKDFFAEAQAQVDALEQNILVLENDPGNRDAVDEIFRAAHTLKSGAATVQMAELQGFTHLVEDVLDEIRAGRLKVTEKIVDVLLKAIDLVKSMLDARMSGSVYGGDSSAVRAVLSTFLPSSPSRSPSGPDEAREPEAAELTEYEILELRETAGSNRRVYMISVGFDETNPMKTVGPIHVFAALRDAGTVLKTHPDFEQLYEDRFFPKVDYYLASDRSAADLERMARISDVTKEVRVAELALEHPGEIFPAPSSRAAQDADAPARPAPVRAASSVQAAAAGAPYPSAPTSAEAGPEADEPKGQGPRVQQGSMLRVDSRRIDNLLNLVSETVINKASFNQISSQFSELQGSFLAAQSEFRNRLKGFFDEANEALAAGHSLKETKNLFQQRWAVLAAAYDPFEAEFKSTATKFRSATQNLGRIT